MSVSRRDLLKMGAALAAVPLLHGVAVGATAEQHFATGSPDLDRALGGGLRLRSVVAIVGPRGSGKTAFLLRLAKANGIQDAYPIGTGTSDMLSIMQRPDKRFIGSVMLDAAEPATSAERTAMAADPAARDAFLSRWFQRTREVMRDSGGLFAISVCDAVDAARPPAWLSIPDYVIAVHASGSTLVNRA